VIGEDRYQLVAGRERFRRRACTTTSRKRTPRSSYLERIATTVRKSKRFFLERRCPATVGGCGGQAMRWLRECARRAAPSRGAQPRISQRRTRGSRRRARRTGGDTGLSARAGERAHARAPWSALSRRRGVSGGGSSRIAATICPFDLRARGGAVECDLADVERIVIEDGSDGRRRAGRRPRAASADRVRDAGRRGHL